MKLLFRLLIGLLILILVAGAAGGTFIYNQINSPHAPEAPVTLAIEPGSSLGLVARRLEQQGVITSSLSLRLLARLSNQGGHIQAGHYSFSEPATPQQVFQRLLAGDTIKVRLTIPEGFTLVQIVERIAEAGYGDKQQMLQLAYEKEFLKELKIPGDSLEGYLFPDTYVFTEGTTEKALLKMMVDLCRQHLTDDLLAAGKTYNLNAHQLVTLASIIEKETGVVEEMPLISSVFHNRLKRGIPLQTDPTVIYGIKDYDGNITRKHLQTPTPYNTYLMRGLPPGPIASPGKAALEAAAHPAQTKYLYFVASGNGGHHFSKTLVEHNRAVREYLIYRKKNR